MKYPWTNLTLPCITSLEGTSTSNLARSCFRDRTINFLSM